MDLWTRNSDRRYYWAGLERDLFGLVVVIAHGAEHDQRQGGRDCSGD